ncbi:hypothetical protein ABZ622_22905 [Streptomyces sp. NPDC007164]|uniref:hypothetical protein n=1 Tax=Streptomyces sp. NPDC007164 TaxID=3156918 RepID=UPI0033D19049
MVSTSAETAGAGRSAGTATVYAWGVRTRRRSRAGSSGVTVALHTDIAVRRFAGRDHNVTRWTELERGGNFLALAQPEAFVSDVRAFFGSLDA